MTLPVTRVVLYKHGVGYFEREGAVEDEATLSLTFKQSEVSDVLKSLTVLDLGGGHIASVSYDSTKPLAQLLAEVSISIPDKGSIVSLLPQIKGARVALHSGVAEPVEGLVLGVDNSERQTGDGVVRIVLLSILTDRGDVRQFDLHALAAVQMLDPILRRDLDYYLKTQLSSKKKDARTFTFFAQGQGKRTVRLSYTLEAPVWKATYRIILADEQTPPMIQGWAVVDNTQDEDWENVSLSLVAGLPVSFAHDLYTPRYIRRPVVQVQETTGVLPPEMEESIFMDSEGAASGVAMAAPAARMEDSILYSKSTRLGAARVAAPSSMPAQVRERKIGDLFEYEIEHPVTIRRNQSALVPIVLKPFEGRPVLLYNKANRADNPMRCVEFKNTTGLTLEGGPVTVLEEGSYVGEAMLETLKPKEERLIPYSVELGIHVLTNVDTHDEKVTRLVIRRGVARSQYVHVRQTTYHFQNKSDREQTMHLEHPRDGADWKLFAGPEPRETTENFWRFRFLLAKNDVTPFVVRQRQTLQYTHNLSDINNQQLAYWLEQKFLDAKAEAVLRQAIELRQQAAGLDAALQQLEQDRAAIHNEQTRIRENLQALGDRPSEKDLRERFVKTLNAQEDRLEAIQKETQAKTSERKVIRDRINTVLTELEYAADV